jgi:hypothetical protein
MKLIVALGSIIAVVVLGLFLRGRSNGREQEPLHFDMDGKAAMVARGTLVLSTYSSFSVPGGGGAPLPTLHRSVFVNGPSYSGMEDNDLRGYLDGTFKYAWNQPTQVHVRIGRRNTGPRYGEFEIFRVLERWQGVQLPPGARVRNARITLKVEESPADTVAVVLYEVKKDWNPGTGGTLNNNVSPPKPGEVWWNDAGFQQTSWGLPGAGFASDSDPNADTGEMPLAEADVCPGCPSFVFESAMLTEYIDRRQRENAPLLFLLKAADAHEDTPGSMMNVYSGNHGDSRNIGRRPHLEIEWEAPSQTSTVARNIALERGRGIAFPRIPLMDAQALAASFFADSSSFVPTIQVRTGTDTETGLWHPLNGVVPCQGTWAEIRVLAAQDPILLGEPFHAEMYDTWVRTAAPEKQKVPWVFVSPTGVQHHAEANYVGESRWVISFVPEEIGLWRYHWSQNFTEHPYQSEQGYFDVIGGDLNSLHEPLEKIAEQAKIHKPHEIEALSPLMVQFARLERSVMANLTPDAYRSESGREALSALRKTRAALGGGPVPDSIPMVPDAPPGWAQEAAKKKKT